MYDLVVVGAGPYGLSVASHAAAAGLDLRVLGRPMATWRDHMPRGMLLASRPEATAIADPEGSRTLTAYCAGQGIGTEDGAPLPLDVFAAYGTWFAERSLPPVDEQTVTKVAPHREGFRIETAEGERLLARTVVLAVGVPLFAHRPPALAGLPAELASHSTHHRDLSPFRGREVTVLGAGLSALETAALLAEEGARVQLVARTSHLAWDAPPQPERGRPAALRRPVSALGTGWPNWVWSRLPGAVRHLPAAVRLRIADTAPRPSGAWWLRDRFEEEVPVLLGHRVTAADRTTPGVRRLGGGPGERVRLWLAGVNGTASTLETEHVLAATGFAPRLSRLTLLDSTLREGLRRIGGSDAPWLDARFGSSCPGLFFAGLLTVPTFGPAMRFVHGTHLTAPRLVEGVRQRLAELSPATGAAGPVPAGSPVPDSTAVHPAHTLHTQRTPSERAASEALAEGLGRLPAPVSRPADSPDRAAAHRPGGSTE
ncbi:NAD(P)-binding domain-containing protein [Streptomyces albus]|uniref:NAD(P)-binding domain-containing protein n=1 Tax=Streptomyces albus TaxID=1888 RepID=UPI0033C1112A